MKNIATPAIWSIECPVTAKTNPVMHTSDPVTIRCFDGMDRPPQFVLDFDGV